MKTAKPDWLMRFFCINMDVSLVQKKSENSQIWPEERNPLEYINPATDEVPACLKSSDSYQQIRGWMVCSLVPFNVIFNHFLIIKKSLFILKSYRWKKNLPYRLKFIIVLFPEHNQFSSALSPMKLLFPIFSYAHLIKLFSNCSVTFHVTLSYLPFLPLCPFHSNQEITIKEIPKSCL